MIKYDKKCRQGVFFVIQWYDLIPKGYIWSMKILFFDMEFANGRVKGSIYSIGYTVTDEDFQTLVPPTDILIDPDSAWNSYVEENILAYPKELVESSQNFLSSIKR